MLGRRRHHHRHHHRHHGGGSLLGAIVHAIATPSHHHTTHHVVHHTSHTSTTSNLNKIPYSTPSLSRNCSAKSCSNFDVPNLGCILSNLPFGLTSLFFVLGFLPCIVLPFLIGCFIYLNSFGASFSFGAKT